MTVSFKSNRGEIHINIDFVEIQNFRRLKSTRIDFAHDTTIFVGSNNSGKTSAMTALRYFLVSPSQLALCDVAMSNWPSIDALGNAWKSNTNGEVQGQLDALLPILDIWLYVPIDEIRYVSHILPSLDWSGGRLGIRLHYRAKNIAKLMAEYRAARSASDKVSGLHTADGEKVSLEIWPKSLIEFLDRRFATHIAPASFILDPDAYKCPSDSVAKPQILPPNAEPLEGNPIQHLIKINEIAAQRDFADAGRRMPRYGEQSQASAAHRHFRKPLAELMSSYYNRHLDPEKIPSEKDYDALKAIQSAERSFNESLEKKFEDPFNELDKVGYPGSKNPKLIIRTSLRETDGLKHGTALQHELSKSPEDGSTPMRLPEDYAGLGFQNLIAMSFLLMGFRDDWMRAGKAFENTISMTSDKIQPLHLVLVEEPEVHLHPQAQQVFTNQAYGLLRYHEKLGDDPTFRTQLIVSTHSGHVAHEVGFENLRYFRRDTSDIHSSVPTSTVANLSSVFGSEDETKRFVSRYLKVTHCELFFADAVIFVEGPSERILVPYFIQREFKNLAQRYISLLDVGGSHAHRFRPLIDVLRIATLIITDLDAVTSNDKKAVRPLKGEAQQTANPVLKKWFPQLKSIDKLVDLDEEGHESKDKEYPLYVAYQKPMQCTAAVSLIPRTFEDAMIIQNAEALKNISGSRISEHIRCILKDSNKPSEILEKLSNPKFAAFKAAFALDCLMFAGSESLTTPEYIALGLEWLQQVLDVD